MKLKSSLSLFLLSLFFTPLPPKLLSSFLSVHFYLIIALFPSPSFSLPYFSSPKSFNRPTGFLPSAPFTSPKFSLFLLTTEPFHSFLLSSPLRFLFSAFPPTSLSVVLVVSFLSFPNFPSGKSSLLL